MVCKIAFSRKNANNRIVFAFMHFHSKSSLFILVPIETIFAFVIVQVGNR